MRPELWATGALAGRPVLNGLKLSLREIVQFCKFQAAFHYRHRTCKVLTPYGGSPQFFLWISTHFLFHTLSTVRLPNLCAARFLAQAVLAFVLLAVIAVGWLAALRAEPGALLFLLPLAGGAHSPIRRTVMFLSHCAESMYRCRRNQADFCCLWSVRLICVAAPNAELIEA